MFNPYNTLWNQVGKCGNESLYELPKVTKLETAKLENRYFYTAF